MKKTSKVRSFILGALAATMVFTLAAPALAALEAKTADIYTGIKVYVNDQLLDPKDATGAPVDTVVINGTTYLPIRAVGNALGLPVQYDGKTQSAFIGLHHSDEPAFYLDEFDYFAGSNSLSTAASEQDNLKKDHARCIVGEFDRTYKLNGQYTALTGNLYQKYNYRSETILAGSGVWIYVDEKLVYVKEFSENTTGFEPEHIDVDLTGALELRVVLKSIHQFSNSPRVLSLGEMALYT